MGLLVDNADGTVMKRVLGLLLIIVGTTFGIIGLVISILLLVELFSGRNPAPFSFAGPVLLLVGIFILWWGIASLWRASPAATRSSSIEGAYHTFVPNVVQTAELLGRPYSILYKPRKKG